MIKRIFIFFLLAISCSGLLAQKFTSYDRYFTWNPDSSIVYSGPGIDTDTVASLAYGTEIKLLERLEHIKASVRIGTIELAPEDSLSEDGYYLPGYWVKVRTADKKTQGYIFSGEAINFPPLEANEESYSRSLKGYTSYFGVEIIEKETQKPVALEGESYNVYETMVQFPEGSYKKTDLFDGCSDSEYHFPGRSLAQVYFLFITNYYAPGQNVPDFSYGKPEFDFEEGAKLNFIAPENTTYEGLFIDVDESGKITFGSYTCT